MRIFDGGHRGRNPQVVVFASSSSKAGTAVPQAQVALAHRLALALALRLALALAGALALDLTGPLDLTKTLALDLTRALALAQAKG